MVSPQESAAQPPEEQREFPFISDPQRFLTKEPVDANSIPDGSIVYDPERGTYYLQVNAGRYSSLMFDKAARRFVVDQSSVNSYLVSPELHILRLPTSLEIIQRLRGNVRLMLMAGSRKSDEEIQVDLTAVDERHGATKKKLDRLLGGDSANTGETVGVADILRNVPFSAVPVGAEFYDPAHRALYVKVSDDEARRKVGANQIHAIKPEPSTMVTILG